MGKATCTVDGCDRPRFGRGFCQMHYTRWQKGKQPDLVPLPTMQGLSREAQFWAKVHIGTDCWNWIGACTSHGYGSFKGTGAHRAAYEYLVGPIPDGMELDHLCRVRSCVNPAHLEPVTRAENVRRSSVGDHNRRKTHCPSGHPYDQANTYNILSGGRGCRACIRRHSLAARLKRRQNR